jgi:hypothetical protein
MRFHAAFAVAVSLWLASPARADVVEEATDPVTLVLRTRLEDAARQKDWPAVVAAFQELRRKGPLAIDARLLLRYAEAQVALQKDDDARAALEEVLRGRPDDVVALPLLARVRARQGDLAAAGDLLVLAARAGRLVLADLRQEPAGAALATLLRDPRFVLRVMNASRDVAISEQPHHDPFGSRLRTGEEPIVPPPPPVDGEEQELRQELEALFATIAERVAAQDVAGVERAFGALRALLARCGPRLAAEELERARARFGEAEEVFAALQLQVFIHDANGRLREARVAMEEARWDAALEATVRLRGICERLRATGRPAHGRHAEALELRAREIAERATTLRTIAGLRLEVTGIVLPPPGAQPRRAIVNDRIHGEGERVQDASGEEIEELRVVEVKQSLVRFRYRDVEFVRPLRARS